MADDEWCDTPEHRRECGLSVQGAGWVKLAARVFENQRTEALVKSEILNRMVSLGMPRSERIAVS